MSMMCYICEICVVEVGNINKNKKMLSGLFAESRALGKSASLLRAWWSALSKPFFFKPPRPQIFVFLTILCRRSLSAKKFFADGSSRQRSSLPTVALGKEAVTPLAVVWPLLGRASLPRALPLLSVNILPRGASVKNPLPVDVLPTALCRELLSANSLPSVNSSLPRGRESGSEPWLKRRA